jgi:cytochrome P450
LSNEKAGAPLKLFGPEMLADPYPVYHRMRAAQPVLRVAELDAWVVTSFESVNAVLRNPHVSSDRFDVSRTENKHIAFGAGAHFCLGAPLARLEAQVVFRTLRQRFPNLKLAVKLPEYRDNFNLRGLRELPVSF